MSNRLRGRRRYRRMTVRIVVDYATTDGTRSAEATTLGAGGLFIATDVPAAPGSVVAVSFTLPGGSRRHRIAGHVVWSQSPDGDGQRTAGMGIAFKNPAASAALALELEGFASSSEEEAS